MATAAVSLHTAPPLSQNFDILVEGSEINNDNLSLQPSQAEAIKISEETHCEQKKEAEKTISKNNSLDLKRQIDQHHRTFPKFLKSATLGNHSRNNITSNSSNQHHHSLFARNNLRRSFTLPRGLFPKKNISSGSSASENGNFFRNIFLTFHRGSKRRSNNSKIKSAVQSNEHNQTSEILNVDVGPGSVGLKNQGNTCFMNAIVQCLSHTDSLAKYLMTDAYKSDLRRKHIFKNGKGEITEELAAILRCTWLRLNASMLEEATTRFKAAIEKGAQQWRGSEQHDAQEFLLWILDKLHEDLNQGASNKFKPVKNNFGRPEEQVAVESWLNHLRCNNSIIQDIFGAQFYSTLTCVKCTRQSATFDPFLCVSLPIPQSKQEIPVYVNVVYLSQQPRQVKLGLKQPSSADLKELKQVLSADTSIEENQILLVEIDGEGFYRTFTETQMVSSLSNNEAVYCLETPTVREVNENDGAFLMITWTNILLVSNNSEKEKDTRVRFGSVYITQIARETGFLDLQKILLKEMSSILHTGVLISEQKEAVFSMRVLDGSCEGSLLLEEVEHPLYSESVDHALSLCDEDVPPHIKLHLEWKLKDKENIIADDSENVEEHLSVSQIKNQHSDEAVLTVTLKECFDLYTKAEELSPEDSWHCPHCNRKEQGTLKMIGLWTAPQVLVVHLKRFRQTAKGRNAATKISNVVDFPIEGLDMYPHVSLKSQPKVNGAINNIVQNGDANFITNNGHSISNTASSPINGCFGLGSWKRSSMIKKRIKDPISNNNKINSIQPPPEPENLLYDLFAVCNHHGKDVAGGHYTAYCKNPIDGTWSSFDDTQVAPLNSVIDVKTPGAYILFYQRRNANSTLNGFHWCRNLLKKYNRGPQTTTTSSTNQKLVNGEIDQSLASNNKTNETKNESSMTTLSTTENSAPLAMMEDLSSIAFSTKNEFQIESTV